MGGALGDHYSRRDDGKETRVAARLLAAAVLLLRIDAALSVGVC